ncbi:MAG: hypothetical protein JWN04_651 [Myxococcaceae bacterium]|nr:hypothetical protein [Myxococcaceae bacterium]
MVLRVVEFCRARGHDAEALARASGVLLAALAQADARIGFAGAARLGEQALAITGDPNFGLHLASDVGDAQHYDAGLASLPLHLCHVAVLLVLAGFAARALKRARGVSLVANRFLPTS